MSSIYQISVALKSHLGQGHDGNALTVDLIEPAVDGEKVSLWLYQVQVDEFTRNALPPTIAEATGGAAAKRIRSSVPPLGVNLYYLVTPLFSHVSAAQEALGSMLLTIHESPVLRIFKSDISLDEQVRISLPADTLDERLRLFDSIKSKAYRLSFICMVRTARLFTSQTIEEAPVLSLTTSSATESPWN